MRTRPWYAARLAVLGAALVAAGLHGGGPAGSRAPVAMAARYRPPVVHDAPAPAREVRTLSSSGTPATAKRSRPRHPAASAPKPAAKPAIHKTAPIVLHAAGVTFQQALDAAIAKIPTYRPGMARWVVSRAYAFWGTADWYHDVLYVSPDVPISKLYDVAVHEWSHELSVLDYGGDVAAATTAMNAWFGGAGLTGPERAADCMAILQGARWTHYTTCEDAQWRVGAAKLVAGQRL